MSDLVTMAVVLATMAAVVIMALMTAKLIVHTQDRILLHGDPDVNFKNVNDAM